jgi:hypothetical protein
VLAKYAALVSSAAQGAVTNPARPAPAPAPTAAPEVGPVVAPEA